MCIFFPIRLYHVSPSAVVQMVKNVSAMQGTQVQTLGWEKPLEKEMAPTSVFLSGEFHGQRSPVVGYSPWGRKKLDRTEQPSLSLSPSVKHISLALLFFYYRMSVLSLLEQKRKYVMLCYFRTFTLFKLICYSFCITLILPWIVSC